MGSMSLDLESGLWLIEYDTTGAVPVSGPGLHEWTAFTSCLLGHLLFTRKHPTLRKPMSPVERPSLRKQENLSKKVNIYWSPMMC